KRTEACLKKACGDASPPPPSGPPQPDEPEGWTPQTYPQAAPLRPQPWTPRFPSVKISGKLAWDAYVTGQQEYRGQMFNVTVHRVGSCQFDLTFNPDGSAYANLDWQNVDTKPIPTTDLTVVETTVALQRPTRKSFPGQAQLTQDRNGYTLFFQNP